MELLTQSDYAKRRGCSKVAVHKAVKAGRIQLIDGKIEPESADRDWQARSLPRIGGQSAPKRASKPPTVERPPIEPPETADPIDARGPPIFQEERARRERYMADQAEMEAAKMRGDLIEREAVARQWSAAAGKVRESMLQLADRLAPLLEQRPLAFVRQTLDAELRAALSALAG